MSVSSLDASRFPEQAQPSFGHRHFWQRAVSRRAFIAGASAGVGGAALVAAGVPLVALAKTSTHGAPKPVPGTAVINGVPFHFNFFGAGDTSTVFDFDGGIAALHTIGAGKGKFDGLTFDADMRIMKGKYVDLGGRHQRAAFGFV